MSCRIAQISLRDERFSRFRVICKIIIIVEIIIYTEGIIFIRNIFYPMNFELINITLPGVRGAVCVLATQLLHALVGPLP